MKNLITGGTGFLGSHLAETLINRGESVRAIVRPSSKTSLLESLGVELFHGDLSDAGSLNGAAADMDRIFHCAAITWDWGDWEEFRAVNIAGVRNMLDLAVESGIKKFIHVSSSEVYGYPDYPADESAPYRLRDWPYCSTKIEGEKLVWEYYSQKGLPVSVIRPVSIYGPRSISFVVEIVDLLKSGDMMHISSGGKSAGLAYVTNVVDAILLAGDNDDAIGQAYNVSDGSGVTWKEYVNRLADITGRPHPRLVFPHRLAYIAGWVMEKIWGAFRIKSRPLITRMVAELFGTDQGFPIDKARRELGYEPDVDFEEGMRMIEEWLRREGIIK